MKLATDRTLQIHLRASPVEVRMLRELADARGVTSSDYLRLAIREAHAARLSEQTSKRP